MQCRDQLSHEVTKKAIKAALKLCMHVTCFIWVTFKNIIISLIKKRKKEEINNFYSFKDSTIFNLEFSVW